MFTGIIQEVGQVKGVSSSGNYMRIRIGIKTLENVLVRGDSLSTNGVCLTVVAVERGYVDLDVMPETYQLTTLYKLKTGSLVNLEPAMRLGDRFGGHIVSGHVDGIGQVMSKEKDGNAIRLKIKANELVLKYIIKKGSITIDGISLTISNLWHDSFEVSVIPVTGSDTTLLQHNIGDTVNLECDQIGKYIERLMCSDNSNIEDKGTSAGGLGIDTLRDNGFF